MRARIRQAVILAAGLGLRLQEIGRAVPKGFLRLGERPIVEESLDRLAAAGIERVVIVTGHLRDFYEDLRLARRELVTTVHNPRFAESGSLFSLHQARALVPGDFLLVESDLIYEPRALRAALDFPTPDVVLLSGPTGAGDEVWVETRDGNLADMSKDRARLGPAIAGELVGISKISSELFAQLLAAGERLFRETLRVDYETEGLVQAARARPVPCHVVPDLLWAEIDDPVALERARREVYPRIVARERGARRTRRS